MAKVLDKEEIEAKTQAYEEQLREEMGLGRKQVDHFQKPVERRWTKDQKDGTTILFGGLTLVHEELVKYAHGRAGLQPEYPPLPRQRCPQRGARNMANRGQCNPTYYTVGNLVKYLKDLEEDGETDIEDRYVFVTAGACGPCRFGMYEGEYRKGPAGCGLREVPSAPVPAEPAA